jgi:predicted dehydrogenase
MLARDDVQVVNVCTPSGLHAEHGIAAAEAGKHVITEKPIDIVLAKIDRLIEVCERKGVKLACIFQHRFNPGARRVKAALEQGKFGQPLLCATSVKWFRAQSYYDGDDWRGTWALDGGVLSNQAIHYIDQMVWLMGEVKEVTFAEIATRARRMEAEDIAQATVHFANGAWGFIQASTITWPGLATRIEVCGTTGAAVMEGDGLALYRVEGEEEKIEGGGGTSAAAADPALGALTGHDAQIADFIAALREGRDPYVTGREARRAVALLTDIYRKATGRAMLGGG